jgi:hypothetical protein
LAYSLDCAKLWQDVRSEDQTGRRKKEADTILPRIARAVSRSQPQETSPIAQPHLLLIDMGHSLAEDVCHFMHLRVIASYWLHWQLSLYNLPP